MRVWCGAISTGLGDGAAPPGNGSPPDRQILHCRKTGCYYVVVEIDRQLGKIRNLPPPARRGARARILISALPGLLFHRSPRQGLSGVCPNGRWKKLSTSPTTPADLRIENSRCLPCTGPAGPQTGYTCRSAVAGVGRRRRRLTQPIRVAQSHPIDALSGSTHSIEIAPVLESRFPASRLSSLRPCLGRRRFVPRNPYFETLPDEPANVVTA